MISSIEILFQCGFFPQEHTAKNINYDLSDRVDEPESRLDKSPDLADIIRAKMWLGLDFLSVNYFFVSNSSNELFLFVLF